MCTRQKLFLAGAVLLAVLLVAGSYFGSRWLFGPDVEPVTEYVLPDEPLPTQINRPVRAYVPQQTSSVPESEDELFSDSETQSDSTNIDEDLEAQLAALSDEEFTALAEALKQDEAESSKYPPVPDGYPETPVWLEDYFDEDVHAPHVIIDRVLIELWNQGDHSFTSGISDQDTGRVYPIYPDVVYITWDSYTREGTDGESIEVPYISIYEGVSSTVDPLLNSDGDLFTEEEILSGAYKTKFPGIRLVDHDNAGYDPATVLNDY